MGGHSGRLYDADQVARAFALRAGLSRLVVTVSGAMPAVVCLLKRGPVSLWQLIVLGLLLGNAP